MPPFIIKKGEGVVVNIHQIHHNPEEWPEHEKFIPERFDPNSKYYLNAKGQKRNPLSFVPFFGGKRICLGKTFAEVVAKFVVPAIVMSYDFEFVDKKVYQEKPVINIGIMNEELKLMVKAKKGRYHD